MMDKLEYRKLRNFKVICEMVRDSHDKGLKVALATGCFDIYHVGHACFLEECREGVDRLVVGVDDDHTIKAAKGNDHPHFDETERLKVLDSVEFVDAIFSFRGPGNSEMIAEIMPDAYCFSPYDPRREEKTADALAAGAFPKHAGLSLKSWSSTRVARIIRFQWMLEPWIVTPQDN